MYKLDKYSTELDIQLENGIYIFDTESGTGKTRLYWLLRDLMASGEQVYAVTYDDILRGEDIVQMVKRFKPKLIVIDRYHMYIDKNTTKYLQSLSDNAIILVDYKGDENITNKSNISDEVCFINMEIDKIEVEQ